jgi:hypothetical protein
LFIGRRLHSGRDAVERVPELLRSGRLRIGGADGAPQGSRQTCKGRVLRELGQQGLHARETISQLVEVFDAEIQKRVLVEEESPPGNENGAETFGLILEARGQDRGRLARSITM